MIKGNIAYLSALEASDLEQILKWRNNQNFRKHFREHKEISISQQKAWFDRIDTKDNISEYLFEIKLIETHELIGVCGVNYINWINRNCQLSLFIGKDNHYIDNFGWAEEAAKLLEYYAFNILNLFKIYCEVYEFDNLKIELLRKLNYFQEARLKKHIFKEGSFYDSLILSKIKKELNETE